MSEEYSKRINILNDARERCDWQIFKDHCREFQNITDPILFRNIAESMKIPGHESFGSEVAVLSIMAIFGNYRINDKRQRRPLFQQLEQIQAARENLLELDGWGNFLKIAEDRKSGFALELVQDCFNIIEADLIREIGALGCCMTLKGDTYGTNAANLVEAFSLPSSHTIVALFSSLDVNYLPMGDEAEAVLRKAAFRGLTELSLRGSGVNDEQAAILARKNILPKIAVLDLSRMNSPLCAYERPGMGDSGAKALARSPKFLQFERLDLRGNIEITAEGGRALAQAIRKSKHCPKILVEESIQPIVNAAIQEVQERGLEVREIYARRQSQQGRTSI